MKVSGGNSTKKMSFLLFWTKIYFDYNQLNTEESDEKKSGGWIYFEMT